MDYDATSVANRYDSGRELPRDVMLRWQDAIRGVAPLPPGSNAADVGCGTGRFSSCLADAIDGRVIGFDRSIKMLARARRRRSRRVFFCGAEAGSLPLPEGSLGMIFLSNVVHHLDDLREVARSLRPLLVPGGFIVVRNYVREELRSLPYMRYFPEALRLAEDTTPSREELTQSFASAGFRLEAARTIEQPAASSTREYAEKIELRVYSDLVEISDECFRSGLSRMRAAIDACEIGSLSERLDLFAFRPA